MERLGDAPYADKVRIDPSEVPPKPTPETDSGEIELTMDELTEVSEVELAKTVVIEKETVPGFKGERPRTPEEKAQRPQTPEERAAKERRDIEDLIFELGEIRHKDVPKIELLLALRDGIGFPEVKRILGSPDAARKLQKEKREALVRRIGELALIKFHRNPDLRAVMDIRVPELDDNPAEYHKRLRNAIRTDKFKRLEPFFDQLDQNRYALEEFFDVQVSIE